MYVCGRNHIKTGRIKRPVQAPGFPPGQRPSLLAHPTLLLALFIIIKDGTTQHSDRVCPPNIACGNKDIFTCENICYLMRPDSVHCHTEYSPDNSSGFFVNNPAFTAVGIFHISIWRHTHSPALPLILLLIRRFFEMSLAYHSLKRFLIGASSFSPSAVSILSDTATSLISCSGKSSSVSFPTSI